MSSQSAYEAFPPGPPAEIDAPAPFPSIGGEKIARKPEDVDLLSLVNSFKNILWKSDVKFRDTIEADPRTLPAVFNTRPVALPVANADLSTILLERRAAVIGGAIVHNISLLVGVGPKGRVRFGDLPVLPLQVLEGEKAKLFSRVPQGEGGDTASVLIFPEEYIAPPGFEHVERLAGAAAKSTDNGVTIPPEDLTERSTSKSEVGEGMKITNLDMYTVSGDIVDFWGIKGLTAKLYKFRGVDDGEATMNSGVGSKATSKKTGHNREKEEKEPARETVRINARSLVFQGKPLGALFPFIDSDDIKNLPIANLELTYSEEKSNNLLHQPGLRLEIDVQLRDGLQWVGDSIKGLFGSSDEPPTIHLSAWLSEKRNWSKPPKIEKLVLQGYFKDMSLKPWNILEFKTMGIELTATKSGGGGSGSDERSPDDNTTDVAGLSNGKDSNFATTKNSGSWHFGFGFIGEVMITNIPEARVPLGLSYRIARDVEDSDIEGEDTGRRWSLTIVSEDWKDIFGFKNVHMTEAILKASFDESNFDSSVRLDITGLIKIGDGKFEVQGQFAKGWKHTITWSWIQFQSYFGIPLAQEDHFVQASIGDLKLSDIKRLHAQITGQKLSEHYEGDGTVGENITFKNLAIRASCTKYVGAGPDRKALQLLGEVTVGDISSYSASLTFGTEGITIIGGVSDIEISGANITIEKAGLKCFITLKKGNTSQKTPPGTGKEEKSVEAGGGGSKRESSFAVLGVVKYENVTFKVRLYTAKKKNKKERDWLVFGSAEHIRLRDAWPLIAEDSFLNLQLENVAVIASSEDRKRTKKQHHQKKDEKDTSDSGTKTEMVTKDGNKENNGKENDGSAHASWDVLSEIDAYNYPIVKGFQICATISSFPQLEHMNNGKKIEGLMLSLGVHSQGKIKVAIRLPQSFRIRLSKFAYLDNFDTSIGVESDGPQLQLSATLTVMMENSEPILVKGLIIGTFRGAKGELYMDPDSRWINPFDLNKELIVSKLGIGVGFDYATVLLTGPNRFSLRGQVNVGDYQGRMDVGVDITKAAAVLQIELAKLDVIDIVRIAGILIQSKELENIAPGAEDVVVFSNLKLYLSSGARFMGEYYERGIQVRGKLAFFNKTGDFDGSFTEDGVVIKGGLDAFRVGGLEVTSLREHKGRKRATMDIEITKTTQKVFIDGIIRYQNLELKVLINADLQQRYLMADISIKLADSLSFALKGGVKVDDPDHLESAVVHFDGDLKAGVVTAIGEGIINGINALESQAKHAIEDAEADIKGRLAKLQGELDEQKKELDRLRHELHQEVLKRTDEMEKENAFLRKTQDEIDELDKKYKQVKSKKDSKDLEAEEQRRKRDEAEARLGEKKREMRKEYDRKIQKEKDSQAHWKSERERLKQKKVASWGDDLRKGESADRSWKWWCDVETERWHWKNSCQWNLDNCYWWEKPYWAVKLSEAAVGLEQAYASKAADAELRHTAHAIMNSEEFKAVELGINDAIFEVSRWERALEKLVTQGPMAYVEEMTHDERVNLDRQIELLDDLMEGSRKLETELKAAKDALDEKKGRLSPQQEEARKRIASLEAEIKLKPFEHDYRNKKQDFDKVQTQADALLRTLNDIKRGVNVGADVLRQVTKLVKMGMPEIKEIRVKASSEVLVKHDPLMFAITVTWMKQDHVCCITWAPSQDVYNLYSEAARKVAALADI